MPAFTHPSNRELTQGWSRTHRKRPMVSIPSAFVKCRGITSTLWFLVERGAKSKRPAYWNPRCPSDAEPWSCSLARARTTQHQLRESCCSRPGVDEGELLKPPLGGFWYPRLLHGVSGATGRRADESGGHRKTQWDAGLAGPKQFLGSLAALRRQPRWQGCTQSISRGPRSPSVRKRPTPRLSQARL
jgi:hypothetical protein